MSEQRNTQGKMMVLGLAFVMFCTGAGFGFSYLFPQGERWLVHWQLSNRTPQPVASSIVVIRAEDKSEALCGEGRWNLNVLQSILGALHQAGASVIAPMVNVSLPVAAECGGLAGLVQLAEVTKQVGIVVYPDAIPHALKQAAVRTGNLGLPVDNTEGVGGFRFNMSSLSSSSVHFGIVAASLIMPRLPTSPPHSFLHVPSTLPNNGGATFPRYSFADVWRLIQAEQREDLTHIFNGKVVFLYSDASVLAPMNPIFHVQLANAYLTNSWIAHAPFIMVIFVSVSLGCLMMVAMMREHSLIHFGIFSGVMVLLGVTLFFLGLRWGWLWPFFSMSLTVGLIMIGMGAWKWRQSRSSVHQEIVGREQQLTQLERELSKKQQHVRKLEEQLSHVLQQSNESGNMIEELQIAQHTSLSQLNLYQEEVQETRRKIERLQEELQELQQHVPVTLLERSSETLLVDGQELIEECAASKILTRDPVVLRLFSNLKKAAATQVPILLLGETGTGKEVFAKAAHALSSRRQGPFISVNMAAIRAELFEGELFGHVKGAFTGAVGRTGFLESAHNGTLFLDEVGDLPLDLQAKLLRFLEDGGFSRVGQSVVTHVDVRIVAATNRDLQDEVRAGRYREDLYYRLRSIVLTLPPLRARSQADHVLLAQSFLQYYAQSQQRTGLAFTQGALDAIMAYQWPGNIRELRQTVAQAVALTNGSVITEAELNLEGPRTSGIEGNWVKDDLGQREDAMVLDCLRRHQFEMQATAASLGWDRGTVTQRLKGLGFQALLECHGDFHSAALTLAGEERFVRVVEGRLRDYTKNLVPPSKNYGSVEEAIADCRKRFRNLPERHFPAVEQLLHERFAAL
jgi:transcriptional regulator with PAS, ATPase and Fis domain